MDEFSQHVRSEINDEMVDEQVLADDLTNLFDLMLFG